MVDGRGFRALIEQVREVVGDVAIRCHFHNTRNTAVANAYAAILAGVNTLDSSVGGVGGCPFAPNATGNVGTEDLVYMLSRSGYDTGIDLSKLTQDDVQINGNIVNIAIPAPELFDCFFNEPDSYVASRETGLFSAPAPDLDLDARLFAISQFRNAALEKGILTEAAREGENVMANLLGAFFPDSTVVVTVKDDEGQVVMPDTCGG